MELQIWDPYRDMRMMEQAMNRMWRGIGALPGETEQWNIPIDVVQKADDIIVKASLPGVKPEEIEVTVEDNVLTLKAQSSKEFETQEAGYLVRERSFGTFYRALRLPQSVDTEKIHPVYENGVLTITMPKAEEKKKKQIKVAVEGGQKAIEASESRKK
jgi:HSP20 family protein